MDGADWMGGEEAKCDAESNVVRKAGWSRRGYTGRKGLKEGSDCFSSKFMLIIESMLYALLRRTCVYRMDGPREGGKEGRREGRRETVRMMSFIKRHQVYCCRVYL